MKRYIRINETINKEKDGATVFRCITMRWDKAVDLMTEVVSRINKVFEIYDVTSSAATCTILFFTFHLMLFIFKLRQ